MYKLQILATARDSERARIDTGTRFSSLASRDFFVVMHATFFVLLGQSVGAQSVIVIFVLACGPLKRARYRPIISQLFIDSLLSELRT